MKKILYIISFILPFILTICNVSAQCTSEKIDFLKGEAKKIKVTYKHLGAVIDDEGITVYDRFNVTFNYVNDDFYINSSGSSYIAYPENHFIIGVFTTGKWNFDVYSKECESFVYKLNITLPKFNIYSLDPLCENIDDTQFSLCAKYYNYDISYDNFKKKIIEYKKNVKSDEKKVSDKDNIILHNVKKIYNFFLSNIICFFIGLVTCLIVAILIIFIKKKKNRGVLK